MSSRAKNLQGYLHQIAEEKWGSEPTLEELMKTCIEELGADEGTLWLLNEEEVVLLPKLNVGGNAEDFIGHYEHPVDRGVIGQVAVEEKGMIENGTTQSPTHDGYMDEFMAQTTLHLVAVPLVVGGVLAGVLSAVKLRTKDPVLPTSFAGEDLDKLTACATQLDKLLGDRFKKSY